MAMDLKEIENFKRGNADAIVDTRFKEIIIILQRLPVSILWKVKLIKWFIIF